MEKFNKWFSENLMIGKFPNIKESEDIFKNYDYIINCYETTDNTDFTIYGYNEIHKERSIFIPITGIFCDNTTLNKLKELLLKLNELYYLDKKVYLHCRSGLHRSVAVSEAFYFMKTKKHYNTIDGNILIQNCNSQYNMFPLNIDEMEKFLIELDK